MNPLGVHALAFVSGWSEPESERAITAAAALGFQILEIPLLDPSKVDSSWRQIWTDSEDLARSTRRFMAAEWEAAEHRIGTSG
jgi:hypothetical protein